MMHELYFDQVVIFWIKYNEAPTELDCTVINIILYIEYNLVGAPLYLIQNITPWSKYNSCIVLFTIKEIKC